MELVSDRRHRFDVGAAAVWAAIASVDHYQRWWPWLREFDAATLSAGERWHCVVRPPMGYSVRFVLTLGEVVAPCLITARLTGDLKGTARLEIDDGGAAAETRLLSTLEPAGVALRTLAWLAGPIVRRGHDQVLDNGAAQFARHALEGRS